MSKTAKTLLIVWGTVILLIIIILLAFVLGKKTESTASGEVPKTEITTETTTASTPAETTETITELEPESPWIQKFFVDEFERPTNKPYISGTFYGKFSNSATTDSELIVKIVVQRYGKLYVNDLISISLYEYGSHLVKNSYSKSEEYKILILEESGKRLLEYSEMYSKSDSIYIDTSKDENTFINALLNNNTLTVRIEERDGMSSYLFDIDCTGFKELFESTDWSV
ncbi:MAG: hypothetical protein J1E40_08140 [Oscillospiraceae bacterium]|nr:hypothetical protein [Oscillospiraceae bacterium]